MPVERTPRHGIDRHAPSYRTEFDALADELNTRCPVAWTETHGGYWFVAGHGEVFDLARRVDLLSSDNDVSQTRDGYVGVAIPPHPQSRAGFLEMDPPEQRDYRAALNPYLSPAAVERWAPVIEALTHACLDERIESGQIDFVDDLANIVPAVLTMGMLGLPLSDWETYCEPQHAVVYTPPHSPDFPAVWAQLRALHDQTLRYIAEIRRVPRPGLIDALIRSEIVGQAPADSDIAGAVTLLIGGGFDTITALTAHSLEWLSQNPSERDRLISERLTLLDSATEEFLRFFTPAQGDGRTVRRDDMVNGVHLRAGDRLWLSWAMANRDASVFDDPHQVRLGRTGNRHLSFGLGVHRCIGSNVARATFKVMLRTVLDRMPDFRCDETGAVHYETTGVINGMQHLRATFTPGCRHGPSLADTIELMQQVCDEQRLAEPITAQNGRTRLAD